MELPPRASGDELLQPGALVSVRLRLQAMAAHHDLATVIAYAFDHRTRMLPFIGADVRMAPAGVRAIGSAMVDAGFPKTRIVLQQWNRRFRPSQMRLDGRIPDLFMVSSMQIHTAPCIELIQDACRIDPAHRPLIIAGGPKTIYEPWGVFSSDPANPWGADVAVTGEEYVLLSLLEVLLAIRGEGESMRSAFYRARDEGLLDAIPGLVYPRGERDNIASELVDTGIQKLLGDLDEQPSPVLGYGLLELPSRKATLGLSAIPANKVSKYSPVGSLVLTLGCKFKCPYCPIPAYNQRQYRTKSGERIAEEFEQLYHAYHMRVYFGADDNFFNDKERTLSIAETLSRKIDAGSRPHRKIHWGTEATVHDVLQMKDHLPLLRKAGLGGLWLGVEDMSGALVCKGQGEDQTVEAFKLLRSNGIFPMPMMMHHDTQPLVTFKSQGGLLNQVRLLRKAGAITMQVMMLTPAVGSKLYVETFESGLAYKQVGKTPVENYIIDGNHVVASRAKKPWRKQLNILLAYFFFYNVVRCLFSLVFSKTDIPLEPALLKDSPFRTKRSRRMARKTMMHFADFFAQLFGMWGLVFTVRRTFVWMMRLLFRKIHRTTAPPGSKLPMCAPDGGPAVHDLPRAPVPADAPCAPPAEETQTE